MAADSPLLAWRRPVYIVAGFAGIAALALLLIQPLLAVAALPGLGPRASRAVHRATGAALVGAVLVHLGGLWIVSPPDVIDALTFASPTPFSAWGVIALAAILLAALVATLRNRLSPRLWRRGHLALAVLGVGATVPHALLIQGAMGPYTKAALTALALAAAVWVLRLRWPAARTGRG